MTEPAKMRVFLDTSVLLQYLRGKRELEKLFTPGIEEKVEFVVNGIVMAEVAVSGAIRKAPKKWDFLMEHVTVDPTTVLKDPAVIDQSERVRKGEAQVKDLMVLDAVYDCDVLLTYDEKRRELGDLVEVQHETPEEFLQDLQLAS